MLGSLYGKMVSAILMNVNKGGMDAWTTSLELMYSSKCLMKFIVMEKGENDIAPFLHFWPHLRKESLLPFPEKKKCSVFLFDIYILQTNGESGRR